MNDAHTAKRTKKIIRLEPLEGKWSIDILRTNTGNVRDYFAAFDVLHDVHTWIADALVHAMHGKKEYVILDHETGMFVGMISPRHLSPTVADIGMWIATHAQGGGYGSAALREVIARLWRDSTIEEIIYETDPENVQSIMLARAVGMEEISADPHTKAMRFLLRRPLA